MEAFGLSATAVIFAFALLGMVRGRKTSGGDFALSGRRVSSWGVSGILLGALVGGASTVGTAEMAYVHGLSAWWFTLGGGLGCLLAGVFFARPLRRAHIVTIPQFLGQAYGPATALVALAGSSLGTFLSVLAQFLSGEALLRSVLPLSAGGSAAVLGLLVAAFLFAGGLRSYSAVGSAKIVFLYFTLVLCGGAAFLQGGTPGALIRDLPSFPYLSLFSRGVSRDLGAAGSLVVGVLSTQIYLQALFAAKDETTARRGALWSALLMPPLGILALWVGLHLRRAGMEIPPSQALPHFLRTAFPPALGGALWGGIFITVLGSAAGLVFGIATNLVQDLMIPWTSRDFSGKSLLWIHRGAVGAVLVAAALMELSLEKSMILDWSFLSMGLRGAGAFFPLALAVLRPGILPGSWALASGLGGLGAAVSAPFLPFPVEPLFAGLAASGLLALGGVIAGRGRPTTLRTPPA